MVILAVPSVAYINIVLNPGALPSSSPDTGRGLAGPDQQSLIQAVGTLATTEVDKTDAFLRSVSWPISDWPVCQLLIYDEIPLIEWLSENE